MTVKMTTAQKAEAWVNQQRIIRSIAVNKREPMEHITDLLKDNRALLDAANGVMAIVKKSRGVDGFHQNGDIAEWDYFDEVDALEKAIAMCEESQGVATVTMTKVNPSIWLVILTPFSTSGVRNESND